MSDSSDERRVPNYASGKGVVLTFLGLLAAFWTLCMLNGSDNIFYAGTFFASALLTLRWYRWRWGVRVMPRPFAIALWAIALIFGGVWLVLFLFWPK